MQKLIAFAALLLAGPSMGAPLLTDTVFGPEHYELSFNEVSLSTGDTVTNQFASYGVNFASNGLDQWYVGDFYFDGVNVAPFYLDSTSGPDFDSTTSYSILFDSTQTQAGAYFEFDAPQTATLSAYLRGGLIESFVYSNTDCCLTAEFLGFSGINFDEIRLSAIGGDDFYMDTLRYTNIVPIPAAVWLFLSGLGALVSVARRKTA